MPDKNYSILIVDDDPEFHQQVRYAFRRHFTFEGAVSPEHLEKKLIENSKFDLLLMDLVLDESKKKVGLELISKVSKIYPEIPIIVVTADKRIETVVEAMKLGARDFLTKGDYEFEFWQKKFEEIIESHQLKSENIKLKAEVQKRRAQEDRDYLFVGQSPKIKEIKRVLKLVADEPEITVLLLGETGVGKEVAARYMHRHGSRKDKPFQAINLSAIQDTLLESTLFGHKKGAFTGATKDMEGFFHQADGGILLLDEIGDIDANIQIKLLRFLETKLIRPVGAEKDIKLDVQIITATHRNLAREVQKGTFRADLFQRLKAMTVEIPPLRERKDDIELIMEHFLQQPAREVMTSEAIKYLLEYNWEGNIRELKNTLNYMVLRKKIMGSDKMDINCLPAEILNFSPLKETQSSSHHLANTLTDTAPVITEGAVSIEEEHALLDLQRIEATLIHKNKVKKDVAMELGFENTDNLRYRIKKYFEKHPHLFRKFPIISSSYKKVVKHNR
jgi:DNA-binding NtrC family response regulator